MPRPPININQKLLLIGFGFSLAIFLVFVLEVALAMMGAEAPDRYEDPFVGFEPGRPLFERRTDDSGATVYVTAEPKLRFFNRQEFPDPKPANTYRVFVLGGSTAYGRPYDFRTSFSKWMELLLEEMDSSRRYEVVNAAGISYASYRIVILMKELVRYQPDLFVVYTGHNEFLEERTYRDIIHESPLLRALKKPFVGLRSFALMRKAVESLTTNEVAPLADEVRAKLDVWSGLDAFTRDDLLKRAILEHFRFNIQQMADIARDHGVEILFINPASNIKDFSPFKSEHPPSVSGEIRAKFDDLRRRAATLERERSYRDALTLLDEAVTWSPEYAEVHYQMGRCYLGLGEYDSAERHLNLAKELDICPLRALDEMNVSVIETARRNDLPVIDLPAILGEDSLARYGHPILGNTYFLDHVHPTIDVHQRIAERIVDTLAERDLIRIETPLTSDEREALYDAYTKSLDASYYAQRDMNLGKVLGWAGKNEEAAEAFRRASAHLPDDPMIHYNLGIVYQKQGKTELAIEHYRTLLRENPRFAEVHFNLGKCYQSLGDYDEAAASFQRALQIEPGDGKSHYNLALCYRKLGRLEEEASELEQAWAADPEIPGISRLMGSVYEREGNLDGALDAYRQNVEAHPDDPAAVTDVGVVYRKKGLLDEAARASSKALELAPDFADAHRNLALIYKERGDLDRAEKAFQRLTELRPADFDAHFDLGSFYDETGRLDDAVNAYRRAVAFDPASARGYSYLGAALGKRGDIDEAIEMFETSIELKPDSGGAHYHLASLYYSRGELEPARAHFQKAAELGIEIPDRVIEQLGLTPR